MNQETGKYIFIAGFFILCIGLIIYFFHDKLKWIGRLPGDIHIEKENFSFHFPIVTCILISVLVSALFKFFHFFLKK